MDTTQNPTIARIESLIALTERLTALITEQAQAFEARRPHDAALNMEETSRLANLYRQEAARARDIAALALTLRPRLNFQPADYTGDVCLHATAREPLSQTLVILPT